MEELETKLAKIQLGNPKETTSYVYSLSEQAPNNTSELYIIAELPLFNPAAEGSCERICLAIASALRRSYRKASDSTTFENAVTVINDELGKLAQMGETQWIDKLNCIIAVKDRDTFSITTTGKVAAFLYRDAAFTDISCSSSTVHPLKTFENLAAGKIKLGDILILSTTELFNYLSQDRLEDILMEHNFLIAVQTVIQILKDNAGPEVAFASVFAQQVPFGEAPEEEVELEDYVVEHGSGQSIFGKLKTFIQSLVDMNAATKRKPNVNLPKIQVGENMKRFGSFTKGLFNSQNAAKVGKLGKSVGSGAASLFSAGKQKLDLEHFQDFSKEKKFFLYASGVLMVAILITVFASYHYKQNKVTSQKTTQNLGAVQTLLSQSQSYLLFKNDTGAQAAYKDALQKMPARDQVPDTQLAQWDDLNKQISDLKEKFEHITRPQVEALGTLTTAERLIKLPESISTQTGGNIVSYNISANKFEDGTLLCSEKIIDSVYIGGTQAAIYNGTSLLVWDYSHRQVNPGFSQNVPGQNDFAGIKFYATNSRVYVVNKSAAQVVNFQINKNTIGKPVVAVRDDRLSTAQDIAIDGNVYVLNKEGIVKFQSGKPAAFTFPSLLTPFSGEGFMYTDKNVNNLYVLDKGNNRIIIMDKKGNLLSILKSDQFTKLKDFQVDEKNKTIYLLNDTTLLKVNF